MQLVHLGFFVAAVERDLRDHEEGTFVGEGAGAVLITFEEKRLHPTCVEVSSLRLEVAEGQGQVAREDLPASEWGLVG